MEALEDDVAAANEAFYQAFRERDLSAMGALWAKEAPVAVMHPGMGVIHGRAAVMRSWRGILSHPKAPTLVCSSVRVYLLGTSAFVTCLEGQAGHTPRLIATNVFTMEDGRWRIVHHQAAALQGPPPKQEGATEEPEVEDPTRWN